MSTSEQAPPLQEIPGIGMDLSMDLSMEGFDINAAFQNALTGVASDAELAFEEKILRMEAILIEGASDVYRDFIDFRAMAAQMEMMCSHDHALGQSVLGNNILSGFMNSYKNDGHNHSSGLDHLHDHSHDDNEDEVEVDARTGKKKAKKKRRGWFGVSR